MHRDEPSGMWHLFKRFQPMSNVIDPTSGLLVSLLCMRSSERNLWKETKQIRKKENDYPSDKYWVRIKKQKWWHNHCWRGRKQGPWDHTLPKLTKSIKILDIQRSIKYTYIKITETIKDPNHDKLHILTCVVIASQISFSSK